MVIPSDIFSGVEIEFDPPSEVLVVTFELSDEEIDLDFETPRLELFEEEFELSKLDSPEEMNWFWISTGLRNAFSILTRLGIQAHQQNQYDSKKAKIESRGFFVHNDTSVQIEKV